MWLVCRTVISANKGKKSGSIGSQKPKSYLQYFAGDKALAVIAFNAKLALIVFLAVGQSISDWRR